MNTIRRREFLATAGTLIAGSRLGLSAGKALAQGARTLVPQDKRVRVLNPRARVPLSFIIDDSTCLVNMGHFCMPQFAECYPDRENYKKPWKSWPREIPDSFVREFGEWCAAHDIKGKYSVVPNPACVGWLDRELPGWSRRELLDSLKLVRELMLPNWDIHPEMITHTRVIDLKTGRPIEEISPATMENSYPQEKKSVDELANYLAYALRILKNCELPCEGITTPGGFGSRVKAELPLAVHQAVREVYGAQIPHYFKYVNTGADESTEPTLEGVSGIGTSDLRFTVNIPAGTGDWFGGWDGDREPEGHRYANHDATSGRMVEVIEKGEPAIMLCHWPGLYNHGGKQGFKQFQQVVLALAGRYGDRTLWMKLTQIARYWAAKELTQIEYRDGSIGFNAPFACPQFTVAILAPGNTEPRLTTDGRPVDLIQVVELRALRSGAWHRSREGLTICFDLPKGRSQLTT